MKTLAEVKQAVDRAFAPDLCVVLGANSVILSVDPVTDEGRKWLAGKCIAGLPYDLAFNKAHGLTIEAVENELS